MTLLDRRPAPRACRRFRLAARAVISAAALQTLLCVIPPAAAQEPPGQLAPDPIPVTDPVAKAEEETESSSAHTEPPTRLQRNSPNFPELDFYFPEGELDFRLNALIKNAFYEGQLRYNFAKGDIFTRLRYRYYLPRTIFQLSVFDSLEFDAIEKLSNDFRRIRGGLTLFEWPHTYNRRTFFLFEVDRITSNKEEFQFSTDLTNTFLRISHQIGTPSDDRSNAVVGEPSATVRQLFTAHQKIGPRGFGFTGAATYGSEELGDFHYVKLEFEGLKRFNVGPRNGFLIGRIHGGSFPFKDEVRPDELDPVNRDAIPRNEFFRLDGRDSLRGLQVGLRGTEEFHATAELFIPWFLEQSHKAIGAEWNDWYWILYSGVGTIGFDTSIYTDSDTYFPDVGFGFEASFRIKGRKFFVSAVAAHAFRTEESGIEGNLSIKTRN